MGMEIAFGLLMGTGMERISWEWK